MKSYRYTVVDVFTTEVLEGNALAVFPDASDLDPTTMQKIVPDHVCGEGSGGAAGRRVFGDPVFRRGNPAPGTATLMIFQALAPGTRLCALLPQLADILKTKPSGVFS
jgi:hypothetical protein